MLPNMGNTGRITNSLGGIVGGGNTSRVPSSTGVANIPGLASRMNLTGKYLHFWFLSGTTKLLVPASTAMTCNDN